MKKTIADIITDKIKKGDITMRSKFSIWAEKLGLNGVMMMLIGFLIIIAGFIFYWIKSNNDLLFSGYGRYGLFSFVQSFPYTLFIIFIALFLFLITIFRKFDFSYKKPFLMILIFILVGALVMGWVSTKQSIGQRFYQQKGRMFRMGEMNNTNTVSGVVTLINQSIIMIRDENNKQIIIQIGPTTHFPFGKPMVDDLIRSVGYWNGAVFHAIGVRTFDDTDPSTLGPGMMRGGGQGRGRNSSISNE